MMFTIMDFLARAHVDRETLEIWIEEEWLVPSQTTPERTFTEADLARVQLIRDLTDDLGVNAEGVGVVLSLVDQVHGLRNVLAEVLSTAREPRG
ncbi:chaperone modulator CbpM [Candidatus Viadribacter manganicus]|nr:chaperone modulator CbpM [Candidatus Viadribacter manganicus]